MFGQMIKKLFALEGLIACYLSAAPGHSSHVLSQRWFIQPSGNERAPGRGNPRFETQACELQGTALRCEHQVALRLPGPG